MEAKKKKIKKKLNKYMVCVDVVMREYRYYEAESAAHAVEKYKDSKDTYDYDEHIYSAEIVDITLIKGQL